MGSHAEAVAAIAALDSKFVWEGMETPMVVKWMDMALQRRRRELHLANLRQSLATGGGMGLSKCRIPAAAYSMTCSHSSVASRSPAFHTTCGQRQPHRHMEGCPGMTLHAR